MRRRDFILGASGLLLPAAAAAQFGVPADLGIAGPFISIPSTFDPAKTGTAVTLSNGNLSAEGNTAGTQNSTFGTRSHNSGKVYFEIAVATFAGTEILIGFANASYAFTTYVGADANSWGYHAIDGMLYHNGSSAAFGSTYTAGDVIGIAVDFSLGDAWFAKNNVYQASGNPAGGTNPAVTGLTLLYPGATPFKTGNKVTAALSSGNTYAPPAGFSLWG